MAQLAIKGHSTRGNEVIALLEMLEGHQCGYPKEAKTGYWFIDGCNNIVAYDTAPIDLYDDFIILTLEEFEEEFPYKVGDKVVTSLHWEGCIGTIIKMKWVNNEIIYEVQWNDVCKSIMSYKTKALQSYKEQEPMEEKPFECIDFAKHPPISDKLEIILGDYEIVQENGKCYAIKKKPKYPRTYGECCAVLPYNEHLKVYPPFRNGISESSIKLFEQLDNLRKLIICRNTYWKIAGEEMGLGKPWEPDFGNENEYKYGLFRLRDIIYKDATCINPTLLIFPTAEMRDAFYENFKELIEACKELL